MEISTYKEMCDNTQMTEETKQRVLGELLGAIEAETDANAVAVNRSVIVMSKQNNIRVFSKKRIALLVAVIALMSSITVMAADYIFDKVHYQQTVQVKEDGRLVFGDAFADLRGVGETSEIDVSYDVVMKELKGKTLEAIIEELQISPYLPIDGDAWKLEKYEAEAQAATETLSGGTSSFYFIDAWYQNAENAQQTVQISLMVNHYEMQPEVSDASYSIGYPTEGADNYRVYTDADGREYVFYDAENPDSGEKGTYVQFSYSDRYMLNKITREHAHDRYNCGMLCSNMTDEEIQEFLDSLVTYNVREE